ncbi:unnamed protein product [Allacma fusca]|uniref:Secretory carrier-associated membrane protein n=1 Tax=Allacma fusca TaxID=39272 RepID=A0A8J2PSN0_9HEXA|nr:unnamed protein product [Allacma fusca]
MSGFDDNPFGDNPFQDPSIQQATKNSANNPARGLEDYNPFEDTPQNQRPTTMVRGAANPPQYGSTGNPSPAVMSPTQEIPPPYAKPMSQQNAPQISTEELQRRQEELERKARELERREEELRNTPFNARKNNWPPLPQIIPIQPCFYQDINVDIPVEFQRIVRYLYYIWILHTAVLIANVLVFVLRLTILSFTDYFGSFFTAIIYLVVFTPTSYVCWFRPAYKAFRSDSSFNFMVFFFIFFFQFITSLALSTKLYGACGIYDGIVVINSGGAASVVIGILVLIVGIAFVLIAALDLYLLVKVHRIYRSTGASFAKAQQEFATGVMRNEHHRFIAGEFVTLLVYYSCIV